jgi:hypothetical protein
LGLTRHAVLVATLDLKDGGDAGHEDHRERVGTNLLPYQGAVLFQFLPGTGWKAVMEAAGSHFFWREEAAGFLFCFGERRPQES